MHLFSTGVEHREDDKMNSLEIIGAIENVLWVKQGDVEEMSSYTSSSSSSSIADKMQKTNKNVDRLTYVYLKRRNLLTSARVFRCPYCIDLGIDLVHPLILRV